ncbi:MAG: hypothetical protein J7J52_06295 [Deltaproteobacteria bacterium]|nr:hypothetical protein [Deltaproteobacteria bacterium]
MMAIMYRHPDNWRTYQRKIQRKKRIKKILGRMPFLFVCLGGLFSVMILVAYVSKHTFVHFSEASYQPNDKLVKPLHPTADIVDAKKLWPLISSQFVNYPESKSSFSIIRDNTTITIETTIVPELQRYVSHLLEHSITEEAAVIILKPTDGSVMAMANYKKDGHLQTNLCLDSLFPAASLFKIVSASAAIEKARFTPNRMLTFLGRSHTLYKNQLTNKVNRYSTSISFRKAFAKSVNPIFGKLGMYILKRKTIRDYAHRFFFDRSIPFDLSLVPSVIRIPEDPYGLAEVTSGFNRSTRISPLHAALFACAVINGGKVMRPWIIKSITQGPTRIYQAHTGVMGVPIAPKTARYLQCMMSDTVHYGTCRKSFWRILRKKPFKKWRIGAKTGTINDRSDRYKYDWVTAYAVTGKPLKGMCMSILEVHGKIMGTRSREIARAIINYVVSSHLQLGS